MHQTFLIFCKKLQRRKGLKMTHRFFCENSNTEGGGGGGGFFEKGPK